MNKENQKSNQKSFGKNKNKSFLTFLNNLNVREDLIYFNKSI